MMTMHPLKLGSITILSLVAGQALAIESYVLKDTPAEVGLQVETLSVSKGGVTKSTEGGVTTRSKTDLVRRRLWQRTFQKDALGGKVSYRMLRDEIGTRFNGKEDVNDGPLAGCITTSQKNGAGNWVFMLDGGAAVGDQVAELKAMEAIENRRWFPNRLVQLGETWEFVPQFIRAAFRRDMPESVAVGIMELVSVDKQADGSRVAKIKVVVRAGGDAVKGVGRVVGAEGVLSGHLVMNLDKPGTMVMRINGTVVSAAKVGAADSVARIPVTLRFESKPLP